MASKMTFKRREINLKRLLGKCEEMAKEDSDDWRLEKYVEHLETQLEELKKCPESQGKLTDPDDRVCSALLGYSRRLETLRGYLNVKRVEDPLEKTVATELFPRGNHENSREIHRKTKEKTVSELRAELLGEEQGLRKRTNVLDEASDVEDDVDTLLKYHHQVQEHIADDMLVLARSIREQSLTAGRIIRDDTATIEKSSRLAEGNFQKLHLESEKLQEENKRAWRFWIWILLIVVLIIFANMVIFMRIMKKK